MKNYIALLIVVILSLSVLFGCGATGDNNETTLSAENTASQTENLTQSETQNSSESAVNTVNLQHRLLLMTRKFPLW